MTDEKILELARTWNDTAGPAFDLRDMLRFARVIEAALLEAPAQPQHDAEPVAMEDVLDALNVFNKSDEEEPAWTPEDAIAVAALPAFIESVLSAWGPSRYAGPVVPAIPEPARPVPSNWRHLLGEDQQPDTDTGEPQADLSPPVPSEINKTALPEIARLANRLISYGHDERLLLQIVALCTPSEEPVVSCGIGEELLRVARLIEALKGECGMDPESPQAIKNGRYMSIAAILRGLAKTSETRSNFTLTEAPRGTDAQILKERALTIEAINGAMAFGEMDTNPPPERDHWLAPFWRIGRKLAEALPEGWERVPRRPTQAMLDRGSLACGPGRGAKSVWEEMIRAAPRCDSAAGAQSPNELMESGSTGTAGSQKPNDADAIRSAKAGLTASGAASAPSQIDADALDAKRYRWIRDEANGDSNITPFYAGAGLDKAVDEAMKEPHQS